MPEKVISLAEQIETFVSGDGASHDLLVKLLRDLHPADIAEVMEELSETATLAVFAALEPEVASEVLDEAESEVTQFLIEEVPDQRLADILDEMPMDDAARLLGDLDEDYAETLIDLMSPEEAEDVRGLLAYPEGTAGRLMTESFVRLRARWTIAETLEYLRQINPDAETIAYLYVTDSEERLAGVVPLRRLVTSQPNQTIGEIVEARIISVQVTDEQEDVAEVVSKYDFNAVPVVDAEGRLVGIVTVDDIVDVLEEEATEDIQRLGGSEPLDQPYFSVSILTVARKRIVWLLLLFFGGTLTSSVMSNFQNQLAEVLALSYFIPLLIGTGGNAGSQTVSTVIRALGVGEVEWSDARRVLGRELGTGLLVGSILGVVGFLYALLLWRVSVPLALVVGLALPIICTWAKTVASLVPLVAERFGIDPTVVSAPLITTVVDATGLAIYFSIARLVLGL
ncbi:MAG TPA: magnesium transporter [Ardenticatenaceae bacterium]|jgi:magnesium transporter